MNPSFSFFSEISHNPIHPPKIIECWISANHTKYAIQYVHAAVNGSSNITLECCMEMLEKQQLSMYRRDCCLTLCGPFSIELVHCTFSEDWLSDAHVNCSVSLFHFHSWHLTWIRQQQFHLASSQNVNFKNRPCGRCSVANFWHSTIFVIKFYVLNRWEIEHQICSKSWYNCHYIN